MPLTPQHHKSRSAAVTYNNIAPQLMTISLYGGITDWLWRLGGDVCYIINVLHCLKGKKSCGRFKRYTLWPIEIARNVGEVYNFIKKRMVSKKGGGTHGLYDGFDGYP